MGLHDTFLFVNGLSNVVNSACTAIQGKKQGDDWGTAVANFGNNLFTGAVRTAVAENIFQRTGGEEYGGTYLGHLMNAKSGYGTPEANEQGMKDLFMASMLTSPYFGGMYGGGCCHGGGFFGGGMYGGSLYGGYFGGGMFAAHPPMMTPMMGFPSSYTEVNITTSGGCGRRHFFC